MPITNLNRTFFAPTFSIIHYFSLEMTEKHHSKYIKHQFPNLICLVFLAAMAADLGSLPIHTEAKGRMPLYEVPKMMSRKQKDINPHTSMLGKMNLLCLPCMTYLAQPPLILIPLISLLRTLPIQRASDPRTSPYFIARFLIYQDIHNFHATSAPTQFHVFSLLSYVDSPADPLSEQPSSFQSHLRNPSQPPTSQFDNSVLHCRRMLARKTEATHDQLFGRKLKNETKLSFVEVQCYRKRVVFFLKKKKSLHLNQHSHK